MRVPLGARGAGSRAPLGLCAAGSVCPCVSVAELRLLRARVPRRLSGGVGARVSGCPCGPRGRCSRSLGSQRPRGLASGACAHPGSLRPRPLHHEWCLAPGATLWAFTRSGVRPLPPPRPPYTPKAGLGAQTMLSPPKQGKIIKQRTVNSFPTGLGHCAEPCDCHPRPAPHNKPQEALGVRVSGLSVLASQGLRPYLERRSGEGWAW